MLRKTTDQAEEIVLMSISESRLQQIILEVFEKQTRPEPVIVPEKTMLTTRDLLEKMKITRQTLYNWAKRGYVLPKKIGNRNYYCLSEIFKENKDYDLAKYSIINKQN